MFPVGTLNTPLSPQHYIPTGGLQGSFDKVSGRQGNQPFLYLRRSILVAKNFRYSHHTYIS